MYITVLFITHCFKLILSTFLVFASKQVSQNFFIDSRVSQVLFIHNPKSKKKKLSSIVSTAQALLSLNFSFIKINCYGGWDIKRLLF